MSRPGLRSWAGLSLALAFATALLDRAARGYRAFPSIDDFAYVPLAWAGNDPSLYPRDAILHAFVLHAPLWRVAVGVSERTVGLAAGFWALTMVLTLATVLGALRLMRALGASGFLLPVAVALGFFGRMVGVGRGLYDGALGDAFHLQWVALGLLLWAYDAFVRERAALAGGLLGLAAWSHPAVALQGAVALLVATAFAPGARWRRLVISGLACAAVSAPAALPLAGHLLHEGRTAPAAPVSQLVAEYWFRQPNHYSFDQVPAAGVALLLLTLLAGILGTLTLASLGRPGSARGARGARGLLLGHAALGAAMVLCYAAPPAGTWRESTLLPYLLDLTRTTPLLVVLGAVCAVAAAEVALDASPAPSTRAQRLVLVAAVGTLAILAPWRWLEGLSVLLGVGAWLLARRGVRPAWLAGALVATGLGALGWSAMRDVREAPVSPEERELYAWVEGTTSPSALFIIPPGMQGFRLYGRRSAYVDFKIFPISAPGSVPQWRQRLNDVTSPDRRALASPGWEGVPYWDRAYANHNTPERIAGLLERTGANYFVWDAAGLAVPPFTPVERAPDSRVEMAFRNRRFEVFRRTTERADGR